MYTNAEGVAEDRLLERQFSRSRFLTVREKHRRRIPAAECFRQVQAGSRSAGGDFPLQKKWKGGRFFSIGLTKAAGLRTIGLYVCFITTAYYPRGPFDTA